MTNDIMLFIAIGFAAQMVDGAIGMAYGITASTMLMSMGVPPATASASVHAAEVFTTAASGTAHWRMGTSIANWLRAWPCRACSVVASVLRSSLLYRATASARS